MKKLILLGLVIISITACQKQEQRYFAESPEINALKAGIADYEKGNWDAWKANFADTAKIYVNSNKSVSIDARLKELKQATEALSSYGFDKKDEYIEMVIDKEKETWVYYWAQWNGEIAANNKKISVPVHLDVRFIDGKIVAEHVYYDGTELNNTLAALSSQSVDEKKMQSTINNIVSAWNNNDSALFDSNTIDKLVRVTNGTKDQNNREEYKANMATFHTAFPDFKVTIDHTVFKGNKAYINWTVNGTNEGKFMDNPATGNRVQTHGFSVWSFNNEGKAIHEDVFYDNLALTSQLGYTMPAPK